jgi:hypothetical protein
MGPALLHALSIAALVASAAPSDTSTYADRATQELVARAMARHAQQDSSVRDYQAKLRYRVSFGFARRKWGDPLPVAVEEQDATIAWQLPNDLRVNLLGRRSKSQLQGADITSTFSQPWFVPRTLGDSIRVFGTNHVPSRAAPHPLAPRADRYYRYAAGDSIVIVTAGHRVTIQSVTVMPKYADGSYVAGRLWLDVATGEVARFTFRFVGTELWSEPDGSTPHDSSSARSNSEFVNRILELNADLEYSLQDNQFWMPYREVIAGKISMPFGIDFAMPFEARSTFDDYDVNQGKAVVFDAPFPRDSARFGNRGRVLASGRGGRPPAGGADSLRRRQDAAAFRARGRNRTGYLPGGGHYEIHRPPADSMRNYAGWGDSLVLGENPDDHRRLQQAMTDLEHITDQLPAKMTGRPTFGITWEKLSDLLRYNRVEGTTLSLGLRVPTAMSFTTLYGTARFGLADKRPMARISAVRDAPGGRLIVAASRDLQDADPLAQGLTFGNSLRAVLSGHDDGQYFLASGARVSFETSMGEGNELMIAGRAEDERNVASDARAFIPRIGGADGYFPPNDSVREGFAVGPTIRLEHSGPGIGWMIDAGGLDANKDLAARLAGRLELKTLMRGWVTTRISMGIGAGTEAVPQMALRAGGLNTVRGYDFGVARGDALWATQFDVSRPSRRTVKMVGFVDMGEAGMIRDFGAAPFLSGAGVGVSVLGGFVRADLSHPITNADGHGFRLDLVFGGPR